MITVHNKLSPAYIYMHTLPVTKTPLKIMTTFNNMKCDFLQSQMVSFEISLKLYCYHYLWSVDILVIEFIMATVLGHLNVWCNNRAMFGYEKVMVMPFLPSLQLISTDANSTTAIMAVSMCCWPCSLQMFVPTNIHEFSFSVIFADVLAQLIKAPNRSKTFANKFKRKTDED